MKTAAQGFEGVVVVMRGEKEKRESWRASERERERGGREKEAKTVSDAGLQSRIHWPTSVDHILENWANSKRLTVRLSVSVCL